MIVINIGTLNLVKSYSNARVLNSSRLIDHRTLIVINSNRIVQAKVKSNVCLESINIGRSRMID